MSVVPANNVDISVRSGNEAEPAIAIDPTNTQRLFAVSNLNSGSNLFGAYSTNGGANWTSKPTNFPGSDGLPGACCDPSLSWDSFGNLFLCYLSGSSAEVAVSTNGGQSFTQVGIFSVSDQPTVTTGPGSTSAGSVWVCFTSGSGMAARGATVSGLGAANIGAFGAQLSIPNAGGGYGDIAVGPAGQVIVTYQADTGGQGPTTVYCNTDPDGLGPQPFGPRVTITSTNVGGFDFIPAQSSRSVDAEVGLAWDRSGGPHNGRLYLVYTDETVNENNDTEIYVRRSDDNGASWSSSVRVNDDPLGNLKSQFNPRIAIDQTTGIIAVAWMDCRNSAGNNTAQNWASLSTDYGVTFAPNVQVSAGMSNASLASSSTDYGDYNGLTMHGGVFYPIWADNSNSTGNNPNGTLHQFDLYTNRVTVGSLNAPTNPSANPALICQGQNSMLSASVGPGETVDWFTGSCGGTAVGGGANPSVSPSSTTTYYARTRNTASGCTSANCATATVTVSTPSAPSGLAAAPPAICIGQSSTLSAMVGAGETVDWFTDNCGGTPVAGGASPSVSPSITTTYYARARHATAGCVSATCSTVTVYLADHTGDFDGNGVGDSDFQPFVDTLLSKGTAQDCIADMNNDGVVDGLDIPFWVALFLGN